MKPVIGVIPLWDEKKDSIWMLPGYMDGLVEAVYLPGKKFVWAVQWHPEFSYKSDVNSKKILRAFVEAAGF